ncbi:MAG TPA: hypothetical protein VF187_00355 [Gemmatimonadales bacterium]
METTVVPFLTALSWRVFWFSAVCFVVLNGAAIAAFVLSRSRRLVDEWTPKLVAADALLLGVGLGVPLVSGLAKVGIHALASMLGGTPAATP